MGSPVDFFSTDPTHGVTVHAATKLERENDAPPVEVRLFLNFGVGAKYPAFFIPAGVDVKEYALALMDRTVVESVLRRPSFTLGSGFPYERAFSTSDLVFPGMVYVYAENDLSPTDVSELYSAGERVGLHVQFRGPSYAAARSLAAKPIAFISHDSRDKDHVARPLAEKMSSVGMGGVWFDEFSLKPGDSLRESIERGIQESLSCVVVLSKNFLNNGGWTKVEFNAAFTKQLVERTALILPVWVDVTHRDVYDYSPTLADIVGTHWSSGVDEIAKRFVERIRREGRPA